jgi:hypothetical protein
MNIIDLKQFRDKTVTLRMRDGEVAKVRVLLVDEEYGDIVADLLLSTHPVNYRDPSAAYTFAAVDIIAAEIST